MHRTHTQAIRHARQLLRDFAEHLDAGGARYLTAEAAVAWATAPAGVSPYWHWYRLHPIRMFGRV